MESKHQSAREKLCIRSKRRTVSFCSYNRTDTDTRHTSRKTKWFWGRFRMPLKPFPIQSSASVNNREILTTNKKRRDINRLVDRPKTTYQHDLARLSTFQRDGSGIHTRRSGKSERGTPRLGSVSLRTLRTKGPVAAHFRKRSGPSIRRTKRPIVAYFREQIACR